MTSDSSYLPRPLQVALASDPARPRLTFYDDATGERVELSAQSLAGWVIKTMNLLIDDLGVDEEAEVSLHLPLHWLTAVWVLAADATGASVTGTPGPAGTVEVTTATGLERFAVSSRPMAMPLGPDRPHGHRDFTADVRTQPDQLVQPPDPSLLQDDHAGDRQLEPGERVACQSDDAVTSVTLVRQGLLAPLAVDGSAVWTRNPDASLCVPRLRAEHVTAWLGPLPGLLPDQAGAPLPDPVRHLASSTP